jgi:hypothetical protein
MSIRIRWGRTVTVTDNIWFTLLSQNSAPIHFDHHYAAQTAIGKPLVDWTFTLALVTGQSETDVSQNILANLGWDEVRLLPNPVFEGDTIYIPGTRPPHSLTTAAHLADGKGQERHRRDALRRLHLPHAPSVDPLDRKSLTGSNRRWACYNQGACNRALHVQGIRRHARRGTERADSQDRCNAWSRKGTQFDGQPKGSGR